MHVAPVVAYRAHALKAALLLEEFNALCDRMRAVCGVFPCAVRMLPDHKEKFWCACFNGWNVPLRERSNAHPSHG
ncbi:MAG: hypothetical protein KBH07_05575 [Flavobacteriales bacterium]|nr:hypothetical protein [Flavobacteriales bacterium]MBP9080070.1 hypothetical protein [Flavobacteriales bacterium]